MPQPSEYVNLTTVWVTTQFVAIHRWKDAIEPVAYLSHPHRHVFHVRVEIEVYHDDREIEFHMLKGGLDLLIESWSDLWDIDQSCEIIAQHLLDFVRVTYPGRPSYQVTVSEDNENGATISVLKVEAQP